MELGKLKLEYNNDIMKTRPFLIQAKTQTIHKLSKKAQLLKNRKGTEEIIAKFKTKAEHIVNEIQMIKKINHFELGRFAMRNFQNLFKIMDTPTVTKEKAMAKLLTHRSLNPRLQQIVDKFSSIPLDQLLEVNPKRALIKKRKEKIKVLKSKEMIKAGSKNDKPKSQINEIIQETMERKNVITETKTDDNSNENVQMLLLDTECDHSNAQLIEKNKSNDVKKVHDKNNDEEDLNDNDGYESSGEEDIDTNEENEIIEHTDDSENNSLNEEDDEEINRSYEEGSLNYVASDNDILSDTSFTESPKVKSPDISIETPSKHDKPSNPKFKVRRMYVDLKDDEIDLVKTEKTVDSFFVTDTGDNYMTVALPRPPDIKPGTVVDKNATNRRLRRAAMFGNDILPRPKKFAHNSNRNSFGTADYQKDQKRKFEKSTSFKNIDNVDKQDTNNFKFQKLNRTDGSLGMQNKVEEKLHPSWEAKKKKMSIVAFKGTKLTFDD